MRIKFIFYRRPLLAPGSLLRRLTSIRNLAPHLMDPQETSKLDMQKHVQALRRDVVAYELWQQLNAQAMGEAPSPVRAGSAN